MFSSPTIKEIIAVILGGGIGSLLRFLLSSWVQRYTANTFFPWGILLVNVLGCLGIGLVFGVLFERYNLGPVWRAAIIVGVFGGFTTFSSFSLDTLTLLQSSEYFAAFVNILFSVGGCILATFLGLGLVRVLL